MDVFNSDYRETIKVEKSGKLCFPAGGLELLVSPEAVQGIHGKGSKGIVSS